MVEEKRASLSLGDFQFPHLFQSFRMAIQPARLALAFVAVTAIAFAGWVIGLFRATMASGRTEYPSHVPVPGGMLADPLRYIVGRFHNALFALLDLDVSESIAAVAGCCRMLAWAVADRPVASVLLLAIAVAALSLAGGAISRSVALQFAQGRRAGFMGPLRFSLRRFASLFAAPTVPLVLILLFGLSIVLIGLIGRIPYVGEILGGLLLPLAFLPAVLITVLLIGTVAGFGLMFPAIGYEDTDAFEAIGRSFAYLSARPWYLGFYVLATALYGAVCYLFVRLCAFVLLATTYGFLQLGFWHEEKLARLWPPPTFMALLGDPQPMPEDWSMWLGALLIRLWVLVVAGAVAAYAVSFYFSAGTIVYALMRNRVDGTPLGEIYVGADETGDHVSSEGPTTGPGEPETSRPTSE